MDAAAPSLVDILRSRLLIGDGAMGTVLYTRGLASASVPGPALNLLRPDDVRAVHLAYIAAGARLIETNTYAANRVALAPHGLASKTTDISREGATIALAAATEAAPATGRVWVAGSLGPVGRESQAMEREEVLDVYREQAEALVSGGVDLLMLETFSDLDDLCCAIAAARSASEAVPIIAQMAFTLSGSSTGGVSPRAMAERLADQPVQVVGANCGGGEAAALNVARQLVALTPRPVSIFPNRGLARIDDHGRPHYQASPEYFAAAGQRLAALGVNIVGGCCGTSPDKIARLSALLGERPPAPRAFRSVSAKLPAAAKAAVTIPVQRPVTEFDEGITVIAEVDPPRGLDFGKQLRGTERLLTAGASSITVADNPLSLMRMSNLAMAAILIREFEANITLHISCRDRNIIGNQSHLLGAAALGITNLLAVTGDPVATQAYKGSSGVFDLSSYNFIKLIRGMNAGEFAPDSDKGLTTNFCIGTAFNSGVKNLDIEAKRVARKVSAGASFVMTQPVYEAATANRILDLLEPLNVRVFIGVMPMLSGRNAEFLHNEVPGISIPEAVRARMDGKEGELGVDAGKELAKELIAGFAPRSKSVYLIAPLDRYSLAAELTAFTKRLSVPG